MVIDLLECCYCKVMLCYDKLQNDICLSAASMSESDFAPESTITKQFAHAKSVSRQQTVYCENSPKIGETTSRQKRRVHYTILHMSLLLSIQ